MVSDELGAFLRSRRARLRPEDVGLGAGGRRRVPGLRREEVAALASASVDYVVRLEQGRMRPSEAVLHALARALRLDEAERRHLFALAGRGDARAGRAPAGAIRPGLLRLLGALEPLPAYVMAPSLDLLAWNPTASCLLGGLERRTPEERNIALLVFLDPAFARLLGPPERSGADVVAALRTARTAGRDARAASVIDELAARSPAFGALWERQDVAAKTHGRKTFAHPEVGPLELDWERLALPGAEDRALMVYSAEPGSPSATGLTLLGALAATEVHAGS